MYLLTWFLLSLSTIQRKKQRKITALQSPSTPPCIFVARSSKASDLSPRCDAHASQTGLPLHPPWRADTIQNQSRLGKILLPIPFSQIPFLYFNTISYFCNIINLIGRVGGCTNVHASFFRSRSKTAIARDLLLFHYPLETCFLSIA